jgi:hypothetical protein
MDEIASLNPKDRNDLFSETAANRGLTPAIAEKDFWLTWSLGKFFNNSGLSRLLMLKGGTSLSKVFNLIDRFSEDIDLILDWRVLTGENPEAERSKSKQQKLNIAINKKAQIYIKEDLLSKVAECVAPYCECLSVGDDPYALDIRYPASFEDKYLRSAVRLEIGPLASWVPFAEYTIRPYAAEEFPKVFKKPDCKVKAIKAERTFWEKATILHHEAFRPAQSPQPLRYSRHYYDLAKMASAEVKNTALADLELLESVAYFKQKFYPRGWARYDLAKPGTLKLVPTGHVLKSLKDDYRAMRDMIFVQDLENEINS